MIKEFLSKITDSIRGKDLNFTHNSQDKRTDSTINEQKVINYLRTVEGVGEFMLEVPARHWTDVLFNYNGEIIAINIKLPDLQKGGSDDAYSRGGLLWSLTDIPFERIPRPCTNIQLAKLLIENLSQKKYRDYYYLVIDKHDTNNVMCRGLKEINNIVLNPSNTFQINWKKECALSPCIRTQEEARYYLLDNLKKVNQKAVNSKLTLIEACEKAKNSYII
jgi:hypothetical protein